MKVGILTHYNVNNQGAQLQMYALSRYLEEHGHEVVILTYEKNFDFIPEEGKKNNVSIKSIPYYIKNYLFEKGFGLTLFNAKKVKAHQDALKQFTLVPYDNNNCDAVVIGSDEVFSIDVGCNKMMYGHGLGNVPAIAYAPAFGMTDEKILRKFDCYDVVKSGLENMYSLSARDTHTQSMIKLLTGRDVPLVCDPVLLYSGKTFHVPVKPIKQKYLLVYAYDRNMIDPDEINAIKNYAKKHNLITVSAGTYHKWCDKNIVCNATEWYSYFKNAECVVTDTFHGSVVAMKNHCNVAVFIRKSLNAFKLKSLLEVTGMQDRQLKELTTECLEEVLSRDIDYNKVDKNIADLAEESGSYLNGALERIK